MINTSTQKESRENEDYLAYESKSNRWKRCVERISFKAGFTVGWSKWAFCLVFQFFLFGFTRLPGLLSAKGWTFPRLLFRDKKTRFIWSISSLTLCEVVLNIFSPHFVYFSVFHPGTIHWSNQALCSFSLLVWLDVTLKVLVCEKKSLKLFCLRRNKNMEFWPLGSLSCCWRLEDFSSSPEIRNVFAPALPLPYFSHSSQLRSWWIITNNPTIVSSAKVTVYLLYHLEASTDLWRTFTAGTVES